MLVYPIDTITDKIATQIEQSRAVNQGAIGASMGALYSVSNAKNLKDVLSECFIVIYHNNMDIGKVFQIPCYPEDISESTSADWSPQTPLGRSSPLSSYSNTSFRTFGISMKLHREMCNGDEEYIDNLLAELRKSVYPEYNSRGLMPPTTIVQFGKFRAKGYVTSITYNWQKPIIDGCYQVCDVSLSFVDVPSTVFSATDLNSVPTNPFRVSIPK